jgi:hypothetical protein
MSAEAHPASTRGVASRYFNPFRVASYLLGLYTLGHTLGAVVNTPRFGPESDAVVAMMKSVHVTAQSADCTWYGFYRGFGLFVSVFFVLSLFVAWQLGGMNERERRPVLPIAWGLFASHVAGAVLAFVYFFPVPMAFSTAIAVLLGIGCLRATLEQRAQR